jgi:long-chain fatty acid transport protein
MATALNRPADPPSAVLRPRAALAGLGALLISTSALAENGLNLIGFGAESLFMGGADVAVSRDTNALHTNPAGLARLTRPSFHQLGAIAKALDVSHADALGNDRKVTNDVVGVATFGYATPLQACTCTVGIGAFAQGGAGYRYNELRTPFGNRDNLASLLAIGRLEAGAAFRPTDRLAVGASVGILYSTLKQRIFPGTSVFDPLHPERSFFGVHLDGARAIRPGVRLGAQYQLAPEVMLGVLWAPRTKLPLTNGSLRVNYSAIGLGSVTYDDASVVGLAQPEEVSAGIAWQASPNVLLSAKVEWLGWSRAISSNTLRAAHPDNALAPPELSITAVHDWKDQWVLAAGAAIQSSDALTWYAGVNYGKNPVPSEHLSPILAAILEWHYTTGVAWKLSPGWTVSAGIEYQQRKTARSTDPAALLGAGSVERAHGIIVPVMLSARW